LSARELYSNSTDAPISCQGRWSPRRGQRPPPKFICKFEELTRFVRADPLNLLSNFSNSIGYIGDFHTSSKTFKCLAAKKLLAFYEQKIGNAPHFR